VVRRYLIPVVAIAALAAAGLYVSIHGDDGADAPRANMFLEVARRDFVRGVRLSGTVEAVESTTVSTPRLRGQGNNSLVIMRLVPSGTSVKPGDLLVEFDRQDQIRNALDRQADLNDLEQQIRKSQAEEASAKATDDSTLKQAESALERARLDLVKNDMLPKIEAEKNTLALEEAEAKLKQLKATYDLKRQAAAAAIHVLEINRDRAARSMQQAQANAERMLITSPIAGIAVIKTTWKNSGMLELQEGDEVRAGTPVVEVVDPSAMRVRARVNQADISALKTGQPVTVGLDAYPDLSFDGRVAQISPIGVPSALSPKVRTFVVLIDVIGSNPKLMPDLTASLDVELARVPKALVVPRDAVITDGEQSYVRVQRGGRLERQEVTLGEANAFEVVVSSGLQEGVTVARNAGAAGRS
jgi:multidrug efflux pump subunit AcrA (membrane-fusion protein)